MGDAENEKQEMKVRYDKLLRASDPELFKKAQQPQTNYIVSDQEAF